VVRRKIAMKTARAKTMPLQALQLLERRFEKQIRFFEEQKAAFELRRAALNAGRLRRLDEMRFIRSWLEKPLTVGAVAPSSRMLGRAMARYVDIAQTGPVIELGPGTGAITAELVARGVAPSRLMLVEFDSTFCRLLRQRYPEARVVQGDAYRLEETLAGVLDEPAAALVSGLPLFNKPLRARLKLLRAAFRLMKRGAPFIQFTYATVPPIPKGLEGMSVEPSERIWLNIPPARVWVYRKG